MRAVTDLKKNDADPSHGRNRYGLNADTGFLDSCDGPTIRNPDRRIASAVYSPAHLDHMLYLGERILSTV